MAYICEKNIPCKSCRHYRYDDDRQRMACFAEQDKKMSTKKVKSNLNNKLIISFNDELNLVAEKYSADGVNEEITIYLQEKDTEIINQDIGLVRKSENGESVTMLVWNNEYDENYTHDFDIPVYKSEQEEK